MSPLMGKKVHLRDLFKMAVLNEGITASQARIPGSLTAE